MTKSKSKKIEIHKGQGREWEGQKCDEMEILSTENSI